MNPPTLSPIERRTMALLAVFGLLVPNGIFLYYCITDPALTKAAFSNPVSLVFISEAFFLMFLLAWLFKAIGLRKPNGLAFILMSLAGSMVFSVPATIYLAAKNRRADS